MRAYSNILQSEISAHQHLYFFLPLLRVKLLRPVAPFAVTSLPEPVLKLQILAFQWSWVSVGLSSTGNSIVLARRQLLGTW